MYSYAKYSDVAIIMADETNLDISTSPYSRDKASS